MFSSFGVVVTDEDGDVSIDLPTILAGVATAADAVYGSAKDVVESLKQQRRLADGEILLHCLPPLTPVLWLGSELKSYVSESKWRDAGFTVEADAKGMLLTMPDWADVPYHALRALEKIIGPQFFFSGDEWNKYERSPLATGHSGK